MSVGPGEGRTTWVAAMAEAACRQDRPVLVVSPARTGGESALGLDEAVRNPGAIALQGGRATWLTAPEPWRWDASQRRRWQEALDAWGAHPGLVVLVELPASDDPEVLLLAASLTKLVWVAGSGCATARATAERLKLIQYAGGGLAGFVLNRVPKLLSWS